LNTSPEHYRVHICHIKQTKKECLTNTIHFKHKHITNPSISPADKLMQSIANLKSKLANKLNERPTNQPPNSNNLSKIYSQRNLPPSKSNHHQLQGCLQLQPLHQLSPHQSDCANKDTVHSMVSKFKIQLVNHVKAICIVFRANMEYLS
jgi:hypothetical protein